jgi:ATP-dependent RNA helicase DHX29
LGTATPSPDLPVDEAVTPGAPAINTTRNTTSAAPTSSVPDPESDQSDVYVSDLDSDLELESLVPTYLKIKGKLYEIDPHLVESTTRKPARGAKPKRSVPVPKQTPAVRKLLSQLQQLTSDALFDEYAAEAQWPTKRNQIAQSQAEKRQQMESHPKDPEPKNKDTRAESLVMKETESTPTAASQSLNSDEDETGMLGDMFSAIPDRTSTTKTASNATGTENVVLRDFGKMSGVSPRKVLEEAVRSR